MGIIGVIVCVMFAVSTNYVSLSGCIIFVPLVILSVHSIYYEGMQNTEKETYHKAIFYNPYEARLTYYSDSTIADTVYILKQK